MLSLRLFTKLKPMRHRKIKAPKIPANAPGLLYKVWEAEQKSKKRKQKK